MGSPAITITPDQPAPVTITPDSPVQSHSPEKPGLWQRFREGIGLPSLDEIRSMAQQKPTTGDVVKGAILGPAEPAFNMIKDYATTAGRGIKQGASEMLDAARNVREGGDVGDNAGKAMHGLYHAGLQSVPFVGPTAENVGNDMAEGNYRGAIGGAVGALAQAAMLKGGANEATGEGVIGKAKDALVVPQEVKAAAAAVPDAETAAKAARTSVEIKTGAASELNNALHSELDGAAQELGVDVSGTDSARVKAHRIGDQLQKQAQDMYAKADAIAKEVTGQTGNFQDIAMNVRELKDELRFAKPADKIAAKEALKEAETQYEAYKQKMQAAGMDLGFVKQADKQWSIGTSYKEVGRAVGKGELLNGEINPSARPLDQSIKNISREGEKRGHVLKNAVGDERAGRIQQAVTNTGERIARETAETRAAKQSVADTTKRAGEAQKRIEQIKKNRKTLGYGAAAAVLGTGVVGGAAKYGGALFGQNGQ